MAFQDFGPVQERYRAEREQKKRKRIIIAGSSAIVLILVVSIGFVALAHSNKEAQAAKGSVGDGSSSKAATSSPSSSSPSTSSSSSSPSSSLSSPSPSPSPSSSSSSSSEEGGEGAISVSKAVSAICSTTDYKHECESSITKSLNNSSNSSDPSPKDLIKAAITVIHDELEKVLDHSKLVKSNDPKIKGAVKDCKELFGHATDELQSTLTTINGSKLADLSKKSHELRNWLSAVISYQQTCVDGFPDGKPKEKMEDAVKTSKQLTSNALAIVSQASTLLPMLHLKDISLRRRLLSTEDELAAGNTVSGEVDVDEDGVPTWVEEEERRVLKEKSTKNLKPNVVVAQDGSGDFKTITDALNAMPKKYDGRYVIYVKTGIYDESPMVTKKKVNVTIYGDGSRKTIVTGKKNYVDGTRTFKTATFAAIGEGFMAIAMGFRNTAGAIKHQAVALRVQSDRAIFLNCRMEGYQDTLYAQTHRQYYRSCVIAGTVDFIFGDSATVFQNCVLLVRRPLDNQQNIITAHGRIDRRESTGFVIQACRIKAEPDMDPAKFHTYLARPWKEYSRTIIMESTIADFIHPDGYMPWDGDFALKTLYYAEFNNKGGGADVSKRVKWPGVKVIKKDEALQYTAHAFIQGRDWIRSAGVSVPVKLGLYH